MRHCSSDIVVGGATDILRCVPPALEEIWSNRGLETSCGVLAFLAVAFLYHPGCVEGALLARS